MHNDNCNQRAKMYCYLKAAHGEDVSTFKEPLGKLRDKANAYFREAAAPAAAAADGEEQAPKKRKSISWFARACKLARVAAEGPAHVADDMQE